MNFENNIEKKLHDIQFSKDIENEIVAQLFGKMRGNVFECGLIDANQCLSMSELRKERISIRLLLLKSDCCHTVTILERNSVLFTLLCIPFFFLREIVDLYRY